MGLNTSDSDLWGFLQDDDKLGKITRAWLAGSFSCQNYRGLLDIVDRSIKIIRLFDKMMIS